MSIYHSAERDRRKRRRAIWIVLSLLFLGSLLCSIGFVLLASQG
jgi:O-antigen/teichoic acid export membrane protein